MNIAIMKYKTAWLVGVLATGILTANVAVADSYPDATVEGLPRVDSDKFDAVYWHSDATLAGYSKVMIEACEVSFRKNWQRDQNRTRAGSRRVTTEDMDKIRANVAERFQVIFTEVIAEGGAYEVVSVAGPDVLLLRPEIVDLDVYAPDLMNPGRTTTLTTEAGRMTLKMDVVDADTQSLMGRVIDRKRAREYSGGRITNSVTNRAEGDRMLRRWATLLRQALDEQP